MADGAHLGVSAGRALGTILSGEPSPAEDERMTDEQFAHYIRLAPDAVTTTGGEGYSDSARLCARLLLTYLESHPEAQAWLLDAPIDFDRARADGAFEDSDHWAKVADQYRQGEGVWDHACEQFPQLHDLGLSGFQVGWAFNAARKVLGLGPIQNPAIMTLEVGG